MTDTNEQAPTPNVPLQVTWEDCCFLPGGLPGSSSLSRQVVPADPGQLAASGSLYVIADGEDIKGAQAGREAVDRLIEQYFARVDLPPGERLREILLEIGRTIYARAPGADGKRAVVDLLAAAVVGSRATFANAGGNRAYLVHDGQIQLITHDPTGINELLRKGFVLVEDAEKASQQRKLVVHLGESPVSDVEIIENIPVFAGDFILLCNDFLSQRIEAKEQALLAASLDPQAILDLVLEPEQPQDLAHNQVISILMFTSGDQREEYAAPAIFPDPFPPTAAGPPGELSPVAKRRRVHKKRVSPALLAGALFFVALILAAVLFLDRREDPQNTALAPVSTQPAAPLPFPSPSVTQAADETSPAASLTGEAAASLTLEIPAASPTPETTHTTVAAAEYACVWEIEPGNSLFSTIRRFNLPYSSSESYTYFAECDLDLGTCAGEKKVIEAHGSIDAGWFIIIPVSDEAGCKAGQGGWVTVKPTAP